MSERKQKLVERLQKGIDKTMAVFQSLEAQQWEILVYEEPSPWTVRDLLAHFLSAEEGLLRVAIDIAVGGNGAPPGFDYDAFNAAEQKRLTGAPVPQLLADLAIARQRTVEWLAGLREEDLDRVGYHPALGEINLEGFLTAIYGHQLMHVRDLMQVLAKIG